MALKKSEKETLRTWVEIDRNAIKNNVNVFLSKIPKECKLMAVVKSNAYGHGLVLFSKEAVASGVDWLGVDSVVEGLKLKKEGIKAPILVFGHTLKSRLYEAEKNSISITVSNFSSFESVIKNEKIKNIKIHIKVDTGMGRQGFCEGDIKKVVNLVKNRKNFTVEGLYTHFAAAKNPSFFDYTNRQVDVFKKWISAFDFLPKKPIIHASATSGVMISDKLFFDMVRVGIGMYGLWPSKQVKEYAKDSFKIKPVLKWKSIISEVKKLPKGSKIGYDLTETLKKDSLIAVVPVGYWHGYPRSLSSIGKVLIEKKEAKVLGRVSMDMIVLDVTQIKEAKPQKEVVLLGEEPQTAESVADLADTINYEIVTRINPLIKRILI